MRLSLRFVIPLLVALAIFAYAALPLVDKLMLRWFSRDLEVRANLIATTVDDPLHNLIRTGDRSRIQEFFTRLTQDERLFAVGFCPADNGDPVTTPTLPAEVRCSALDRFTALSGDLLQTATGPVFISVRPLAGGGKLVLVHDMSFIARRSRETRDYLFLFFVGLGLTVALITVVIAQLSWRGWVQGLRALLHGEGLWKPASVVAAPELRPFARDVRELVRELERQYRPQNGDGRIWTQETLRSALRSELRGNDVIAVSNREPYIHIKTEQGIRVQRPA